MDLEEATGPGSGVRSSSYTEKLKFVGSIKKLIGLMEGLPILDMGFGRGGGHPSKYLRKVMLTGMHTNTIGLCQTGLKDPHAGGKRGPAKSQLNWAPVDVAQTGSGQAEIRVTHKT
jgi:hypothetical protein